MENRYGFTKQGRSDDFREEDVWDLMNDDRESGFRSFGEFHGKKPMFSISRRLPSAARMIPRTQKHEEIHDGDDHDEKPKVMMHQHSAPVNIPDWSKIYGKSPRRKNSAGTSFSTHDDDDDDDDDAHHDEYYDYHDDDDDDGGGMALPPHEWLARKLARSQISSFSVCEGAGRTLKGRDLSRDDAKTHKIVS
ncbi:hypothetical protein Cgig2_015600 [Carnegiea gigantea]|uniref:Senescence regulator S40 n=1 Tax=Carnegiea gigantea TaxID=171969 RepID=A0A9Q1GXF7_9CARY|nr:hypothetical protein Cgig2_015600 [Carnegiea gigantea]